MASKYSRNVHIRGGKMFIVWVSIRPSLKIQEIDGIEKQKTYWRFPTGTFLQKKGIGCDTMKFYWK